MRRSISVCWMTVSTPLLKIPSKSALPESYAFFMSWAESLIGVSGFLTSCAICRAISTHAESFFERMSSVRSSNTTTVPRRSPPSTRLATTAFTVRAISPEKSESSTSRISPRRRDEEPAQRREPLAERLVRALADDRRPRHAGVSAPPTG